MSKHKAAGGPKDPPRRSKRSRTSRTTPTARNTRPGRSSPPIALSYQTPISRLLDAPELGALVPRLPGETLHALVHHAGLHACGDLIAAATPAQLTSVLDLDLWPGGRPGHDEQFDAHRFGEWLEVLAEMAASVSARIVAALDEDLVVAGLSRHIRVFDPAALAPAGSIDDEWRDGAATPHDGPECELGGYLVRGTGTGPWDAVVALLSALDEEDQPCFHAVMRGCRRLSNSTPEIDGLDELFTAPQQQIHDVAVKREHRRSERGYMTPAEARAFLHMARHRTGEKDGAKFGSAIAAASFRATGEPATAADGSRAAAASPALDPAPASIADAHALAAINGLLADAGLLPRRSAGLIAAPVCEPSPVPAMRRVLEYASEKDVNAYFARTRELAFLTNTLIAGCSVQSRPFTPHEASEAVVSICNLGLEYWPARWPGSGGHTSLRREPVADAFLVDHDLVTTFAVGWAVLYEDVSVFVAEHLIATLAEVRCIDPEIEHGLKALGRTLVRERAAGTPWGARDALDVLGMLDMAASAGLAGLLGECPGMPHALTAILDRQTAAVSATSFDFISTAEQVGAIRVFMRTLPRVLGG